MVKRKYNDIQNDIDYKNDIDCKNNEFDSNFFDEASKMWKSNKINRMNGTYEYKCRFQNHKKNRCTRALYEYELIRNKKVLKENCDIFCKMHINQKYNPEIHTFC